MCDFLIKSADSVRISSLLGLGGVLVSFILTLLLTGKLMNKLPRDGGRAFAVEGSKSVGKPRGAGIIFVFVFIFTVLVFAPIKVEYLLYLALIAVSMFTGYLDDAAAAPWGGLKKGLLDLAVSVLTAAAFLYNNEPVINLSMLNASIRIPVILYFILASALVWGSINVTNCADGVDGLSGTLTIISLMGFYGVMKITGASPDFVPQIMFLIFAVLAYLWYNSNPSKCLMGDAGSRALGLFIAVTALKSGDPLLYPLLVMVIALDGGLGLLKVFLIRAFKIYIFKKTTMPLHDHVRKNLEDKWSNPQVVFRFAIIQAVLVALVLYLVVAAR